MILIHEVNLISHDSTLIDTKNHRLNLGKNINWSWIIEIR